MASIPFVRTSLKSTFLLASVILLSLQLVIVNGHGDSNHDDSGGHEVDLHTKGLVLVKAWCLIILLVSTFAGGISPYFYRWNESFLLMGTQFSGGVFLGTSLMHFLSDADATFRDLTTKTFPLAFMLASAGYLQTMLGDCVVLFVTRSSEREDRLEVEEGRTAAALHDHKEDGEDDNPVFLKTSSFGDTILLIPLCFHSVFEGIAVGVAGAILSKIKGGRNLHPQISLHKIFAAIAMGIALLRMLPKRAFLVTAAYSFAFAVSSPIGVGIGIAINATTQGHVADWIYAISMGLACGVFIYVAINHLIAKGFKPQAKCYVDTPAFKFVAVLLGVGVIAIVVIWD